MTLFLFITITTLPCICCHCFSLKITYRSTERTDYSDAAEQPEEQDPSGDEEDFSRPDDTDGPRKLSSSSHLRRKNWQTSNPEIMHYKSPLANNRTKIVAKTPPKRAY